MAVGSSNKRAGVDKITICVEVQNNRVTTSLVPHGGGATPYTAVWSAMYTWNRCYTEGTAFLKDLIVLNLTGGMLVQRVQRWTCDQQVVGSHPTRDKSCVTTLSKLFTPMCLCHQAV